MNSSSAAFKGAVRDSRVVLACACKVDDMRLCVARKKASMRVLKAKKSGSLSSLIPVVVVSRPNDHFAPARGTDPIPGFLAPPLQSTKFCSLKRRSQETHAKLPQLRHNARHFARKVHHRLLSRHSTMDIVGYADEAAFVRTLDCLFISSRDLKETLEEVGGSAPTMPTPWANFSFMHCRKAAKESAHGMSIEGACSIRYMDAFPRGANGAAVISLTVEAYPSSISSSSSSCSSSFPRSSSTTPSFCTSCASDVPSLYNSPALFSTVTVKGSLSRGWQKHRIFSCNMDENVEAQLSNSLAAGTTALSVGYSKASILTQASSNESLYGNDLSRAWNDDLDTSCRTTRSRKTGG